MNAKPTLRTISTVEELAELLGVPTESIKYLAFEARPAARYATFQVAKHSGGHRRIEAPRARLREVQRRLLALLTPEYRPRKVVHGFVPKRGILSNADPHANRALVLNVDLQDFFPSINPGRVRGALMAKPLGLHEDVATLITRLTTVHNRLPQGAPTSPFLANLVCAKLDSELLRLAKAHGLRYTRYADDITLSTRKRLMDPSIAALARPPSGTEATVGNALRSIIEGNGFRVNDPKVRLYSRSSAQRVTGLIVNKFPNVERRFVRELRAMIHAWRKFGEPAAESTFQTKYAKRHRAPSRGKPSFRRTLIGRLNFLKMIRGPANRTFISLARQCRELDPTLFPHALDGEELLYRSVWVLECEESFSQGTAFFAKGIGLVTCFHVLGKKTVAFHPADPTTRYPVTVLGKDEHRDLAILSISAPSPSMLDVALSPASGEAQRILIAGYPNYKPGDGLYRNWGNVLQHMKRSASNYLVTNAAIAGGNSGGPVLDERYRVVGVVARGVKTVFPDPKTPEDAYAALSVQHLWDLQTATQDGATADPTG